MRLGIFKEVQPDLVSTFSSQAAVFEGHPFIIEAGVSIGGKNAKVVRSNFFIILGVFVTKTMPQGNNCLSFCESDSSSI